MITSKSKNAIIVAIIAMMLLLTGFSASDIAEAKTTPAKVKISSLKAKGKTVTVKWKKAKGAKKYQVYVKAGKKKFKKVKTLKKRTYKFKGKYNTLYKVKIRGIKGKTKGKFSAIKKVRTPKSYYQKTIVNLKKLKKIILQSPKVDDLGYHYIQYLTYDSSDKLTNYSIAYNSKSKHFEFDSNQSYSNFYFDMKIGSNKTKKMTYYLWDTYGFKLIYTTKYNIRNCAIGTKHTYYNEDGEEVTGDMKKQCQNREYDARYYWNKLLKEEGLSLYKIGWKKYK